MTPGPDFHQMERSNGKPMAILEALTNPYYKKGIETLKDRWTEYAEIKEDYV